MKREVVGPEYGGFGEQRRGCAGAVGAARACLGCFGGREEY